MKLTAILLTAACLTAGAKSHSQNITLTVKNASLEKVFTEVKKQTGYQFFYKDEWMEQTNKVDLQVSNATLEQVLDICFKNQPFTYQIVEKTVVIKAKPADVQTILQGFFPPPPIDVHGKVVNEKGEPVAGVTVLVKGTKNATATDINGEFTLTGVDEKATLVFTSTNVETFEIKVNGKTDLAINLKTKVSKLDEIQIIAYGQTTQRFQTGNVTTVKGDDIQKQPVNNPLLALAGRVPGLLITQSTGIPGGGITVRIEGQNSLSRGNDPLYVIDGIPFSSQLLPDLSSTFGAILGNNGNTSTSPAGNGNPLSFINPADIESIEILKDADATSIYGSRAAAGAILITTKKAQSGQTKVDFNFQTGWGKVNKFLNLLNTEEYLQIRHEAKTNDNATILLTDYDLNSTWDTTRFTDWQKTLLGGIARYSDGHISISGGTVNTKFLLSGGYHHETTVFPGDLGDTKASVAINMSHCSINQKFRSVFSGMYVADNNQLIRTDLTNAALRLAPNAPALYNSDGSLNWAPLANGNSSWYNPLAYFKGEYNKKVNNLISSALISYELLTGLELKSNLGYTFTQSKEFSLLPNLINAPELRASTARTTNFLNGYNSTWIIEPQLTFKRNILGNALDALIGTTFLNSASDVQQLTGSGFNNDQVMRDIKSASSISIPMSQISVYKYNALFGRLNFNSKNKYIFNLTARRDGSSRFGSENQFHNFASIAGAWLFSNESFIKKQIKLLSYGKLRISYGTTGNDQIGDYKFMNLFNSISVPVTYQGAIGLTANGLSNPYLEWEETKKLQFGLDIGLIRDRFLLNVNYFINRSSNQLQGYLLPFTTGFNNIQINFPATVENSGLELSTIAKIFESKSLAWSINFNITIPKNKLIEYADLDKSTLANFYTVGQPIPVSTGSRFSGVDPTTGLFVFLDKNGNVISVPATNDLTTRNVALPRLYGGIENTFKYKGFSIDALVQFVEQDAANYIFGLRPGSFSSNATGSVSANQPTSVLNRWQKPGDNSFYQKLSSTYPAAVSTANTYATVSDAAFSNASFIRLKNVSISYQISDKISQKAGLKAGRIYIQGQNLYTITNYIGLDPESKSLLNLPPLRVITIGMQITL